MKSIHHGHNNDLILTVNTHVSTSLYRELHYGRET